MVFLMIVVSILLVNQKSYISKVVKNTYVEHMPVPV